ncbi:hypothetical protein JMF89_00940 [Clostridiaceae bacterium UIB06]|uniref:Uncharacterized protein n=1 Tax=Clostridium thailandense TaxID=2794346 RepID=A0A949TYZ0_9CLOT|nr:hypothetical protein [Clostridium thailandense]MBV7273119.1 hypothetical protein [Clostridium thailandense]MCH5135783.1 hypothetical protein [Clostridiaceae bacterium UIB06]
MQQKPKYEEIIDVNIGDKIVASLKQGSKKPVRNIVGRIIFKNKMFITIQGKDYKESINLINIMLGDTKIRKIS